MLVCPHCERHVTPKPGDGWFVCPHCELPIRKVTRNGNAELQPGMRYAQAVRLLQYLSRKPEGKPVLSANLQSKLPNLAELLIPLETIEERLADIQARKEEIDAAREELGRKINVLTKNSEQRENFHTEVDKLSKEYEASERYARQLLQVKTFLSAERNRARMEGSLPVSVCSLLLAIAGLIIFAWVGGIAWDWKTIGTSILIMIASPIVMYNVASSNQ